MTNSYLLSLSMWLAGLCKPTYFVSCIMYTHVIHACGINRYIHSTHAYGFKTIFKILVFKQVVINGIVNSSKML